MHKASSWKQKIDPYIDRIIKTHVDFFEQLERHSNEGRLNFSTDFIEPISQKSGWQNSNDYESFKDFLEFIKGAGGLESSDVDLIISFIDSFEKETPADFLKISPNLITELPEKESRDYYLRKFDSFKNDPDLTASLNTFNEKSLDFYSVIISLFMRFMFTKLFDNQKKIIDENIEFFKTSNAVIIFLNAILSSFSQIANLKTLADLKEDISKGDDKAIFKAVMIDKSILYLEEVKNKVQAAQLTGDSKFFSKLGKAIMDNPLKRIGQHGKTYSVLKLFWIAGLYKLTNDELYDLLKSCGLIPPNKGYAFQKFAQRHIKTIYSF